MTSQTLKRLQFLVYFSVAGVALSFVGAVVTALQSNSSQSHTQSQSDSAPVALPAGL